MVFVNGALAFERRVDRGAAPDQDRAELTLERGPNLVVLKIVNTGGPGGAYWRQLPREGELSGELGSALLPADAVSATQAEQFHSTWRRRHFEGYRVLDDEHAAQAAALEAARSAVPKAMVMRERAEPRPTFVMQRGQYDLPDPERPVQRSTPGFLPPLSVGNAAEEASRPPDRLSLARWLTAPQNPLFSRVAVNRLWQQVFGQGLVRTPQDFGIQGEWPTHPELLDWLAVELRESGWDTDALLRTLLSSATYRQASVHRPELDELDPEGRLLAAYPRRRLSAEQIRDHALFVSGLLVERLGGPPVKPHQPEGLWREVSMLASNTRDFVPDEGEGQRRRSLYTYWKRAVPPPSLQTFDAPTRESCVIQRQVTNTPLQALVLWNDVQYVEAARALAARALAAADEDAARLEWMLLACTARTPDEGERELWLDGLARFRAEFRRRPEDARALLAEPDMDAESEPLTAGSEERAAWTLLANAALNLHETLTQD